MRYLLDTDVVVDHLRSKRMIDEDVLSGGAAISIITLGELIYGACRSHNPDRSLATLEKSLQLLALEVKNLDDVIIVEFGKIKAGLEKSGAKLEDFDILIGATARRLGLTLVTRNVKHFGRISHLTVQE
ncbi:MAG: type II toxin-antitoxin system VapC family toxin [Chloroflexi bacterium]|nr:type II toxin-antitoxin system VapC family toxin [Chloroflexota bacterium]